MRKNLKLSGGSDLKVQSAVIADPHHAAKNDDNDKSSILMATLQELISNDCREIHFQQDADVCRVRKRINGQLDENRVDSLTLADDLINHLIQVEPPLQFNGSHPSYGERKIEIRVGNSDCVVEYAYYPTSAGPNLTIQIHQPDNLPETLDQTSLSAAQICLLRNQVLKQAAGITVVCGPHADLLQDIYYGFIGDANCIERKVVSIEHFNRKKIARINHIALAELDEPRPVIGMATRHADQVFIEFRCAGDKQLIRQIVSGNQAATIFMVADNTTTALRQLTDYSINERQLASRITSLVHVHKTRLACPHCADPHELSGSDMQLLQTKSLNSIQPNLFIYNPGCERCEFSGSINSQTLLSVCTVEDNLRSAIETRNVAAIDKATQAITGLDCIENQIEALVSQGKVSFTELRL